MGSPETATSTGNDVATPSHDDPPFEFVARLDQLSRDDARIQVEVRGRHVMLLRKGDEVFAMDATCYHMGAPLLRGDVEDVPGHGACITCPWHHYQISLTTGERLYVDMTKKTCTLPKKQRVHSTRVVDGNVFVKLSGGGKSPPSPVGTPTPQPHELPKLEWESDRYAFKPPPPSQGASWSGGRGKARNGQFLRGGRGAGLASNSKGLHPGLRNRGVGEMVAHSMRGGDGKAPWAMKKTAGDENPGDELPSPPVQIIIKPPPARMARTLEFEPTSREETGDVIHNC